MEADVAKVIVTATMPSEVERNGEDHFPGRCAASENKIIGDPVKTIVEDIAHFEFQRSSDLT
jgi:hypothetical protein